MTTKQGIRSPIFEALYQARPEDGSSSEDLLKHLRRQTANALYHSSNSTIHNHYMGILVEKIDKLLSIKESSLPKNASTMMDILVVGGSFPKKLERLLYMHFHNLIKDFEPATDADWDDILSAYQPHHYSILCAFLNDITDRIVFLRIQKHLCESFPTDRDIAEILLVTTKRLSITEKEEEEESRKNHVPHDIHGSYTSGVMRQMIPILNEMLMGTTEEKEPTPKPVAATTTIPVQKKDAAKDTDPTQGWNAWHARVEPPKRTKPVATPPPPTVPDACPEEKEDQKEKVNQHMLFEGPVVKPSSCKIPVTRLAYFGACGFRITDEKEHTTTILTPDEKEQTTTILTSDVKNIVQTYIKGDQATLTVVDQLSASVWKEADKVLLALTSLKKYRKVFPSGRDFLNLVANLHDASDTSTDSTVSVKIDTLLGLVRVLLCDPYTMAEEAKLLFSLVHPDVWGSGETVATILCQACPTELHPEPLMTFISVAMAPPKQ